MLNNLKEFINLWRINNNIYIAWPNRNDMKY